MTTCATCKFCNAVNMSPRIPDATWYYCQYIPPATMQVMSGITEHGDCVEVTNGSDAQVSEYHSCSAHQERDR
jgi:hypothetical protein